ncbi:hypothetical protein [Nostoc sp. 'Lobaria pulmonaria (5183) cyanobiont']|uniref:hypothetical protein n=1 Tax=Nostoc sp. 'Lobaria pulmonaria (5183) cyanobiont' TaxID=1618022 RepID=UPI0018F8A134|nr:hypothetical protein [Nostoc sp. 'Lobaria pulmonaria (5183) cyanobiont']
MSNSNSIVDTSTNNRQITKKVQPILYRSKSLKIILLGPSLLQQGGISNYEKLFLEYAPSEVHICHIITHEEGAIAIKIIVFLKAIWKFVWMLVREEVDIVQLEISQRGSVLRQGIMTFLAWVFHKPIILHDHRSQFHVFYAELSLIENEALRLSLGAKARTSVFPLDIKKHWIYFMDLYGSVLNLRC